jgi:hypothetical protein
MTILTRQENMIPKPDYIFTEQDIMIRELGGLSARIRLALRVVILIYMDMSKIIL